MHNQLITLGVPFAHWIEKRFMDFLITDAVRRDPELLLNRAMRPFQRDLLSKCFVLIRLAELGEGSHRIQASASDHLECEILKLARLWTNGVIAPEDLELRILELANVYCRPRGHAIVPALRRA